MALTRRRPTPPARGFLREDGEPAYVETWWRQRGRRLCKARACPEAGPHRRDGSVKYAEIDRTPTRKALAAAREAAIDAGLWRLAARHG